MTEVTQIPENSELWRIGEAYVATYQLPLTLHHDEAGWYWRMPIPEAFIRPTP